MRHLSTGLQPLLRDTNATTNRFTLAKTDRNSKRLTVTWFDNRLDPGCDIDRIARLWRYMSGQSGAVVSNERVKATSQFAAHFTSDFSVERVKVVLSGECTGKRPSTRPPTAAPPVLFQPEVADASAVFNVAMRIGVLTRVPVDTNAFILPPRNDAVRFELVGARGGAGVPGWISVDARSQEVIALPFSGDFNVTYNYERRWDGGLVAVVGGQRSQPLQVRALVDFRDFFDLEMSANYQFRLEISNLNEKVSCARVVFGETL